MKAMSGHAGTYQRESTHELLCRQSPGPRPPVATAGGDIQALQSLGTCKRRACRMMMMLRAVVTIRQTRVEQALGLEGHEQRHRLDETSLAKKPMSPVAAAATTACASPRHRWLNPTSVSLDQNLSPRFTILNYHCHTIVQQQPCSSQLHPFIRLQSPTSSFASTMVI